MKVINHVNEESVLVGVQGMKDYAFSSEGGFIQQEQSIIKLNQNGSIGQLIDLSSVFPKQICSSIKYNLPYNNTLSACKNGNYVYLYLTEYKASKYIVNGPY